MVVTDLNNARRIVAIAEKALRERLETKGFTAAEMGLVVDALESKGEV